MCVRNRLFFVSFLSVSCRQRSLIHALGWVAMVLYVGLLYFDLMENADIVWPSLGVLRPVLCIVFGAFYFFTTTHPLFRWVVRAHVEGLRVERPLTRHLSLCLPSPCCSPRFR